MLFFVQEAEFGRATACLADETFARVGANGLAKALVVWARRVPPKRGLWSVIRSTAGDDFLFDLPLLAIRGWITNVNEDVVKTI